MHLRFLLLLALLFLGSIGIVPGFSLVSKLEAFAPKLDMHVNDQAVRDDYDRLVKEEAEARKIDQENRERKEREEKERQQREERARIEYEIAKEKAEESRKSQN